MESDKDTSANDREVVLGAIKQLELSMQKNWETMPIETLDAYIVAMREFADQCEAELQERARSNPAVRARPSST